METVQIPDEDDVIPVPAAVTAIAAGDAIRPVWLNELGGITFELGEGDVRRFAKWAPPDVELDLTGEAERLRWAAAYSPVPRVLAEGADAEGRWLVTAGLPGRSAVARRWRSSPRLAVQAAGSGLRRLHEALPVDECPFDWSVASRKARSSRWSSTPDPALGPEPPIDRLVVCHGDPCVPNTLLLDDGTWSGHVDFDALGVADRWADLAVASMSLGWNYGDGWEGVFFEAYGIAPDPARIAFYRRLWDAT
ncbi:putative phosphotransferase [Frondihabitans sucicola]|uniref:Phosphotransferase n=1 Tax=Frondihabitans sucicola TaxID=1268041 RepID=A0ABM8GIJ9_9MICO|nr:aminoglycoside 3'-phosphotransferase [Frondihabitans sucicola]BDZ48209.1 putative phosphotransferase [Frondihabitans sucicola]